MAKKERGAAPIKRAHHSSVPDGAKRASYTQLGAEWLNPLTQMAVRMPSRREVQRVLGRDNRWIDLLTRWPTKRPARRAGWRAAAFPGFTSSLMIGLEPMTPSIRMPF